MSFVHFCYTPFTGRGKLNKGNKWFKERIEIFKQYTLKSLLAQTNKNFIHWIGWCRKDRNNQHVKQLGSFLKAIGKLTGYRFVFTFGGLAIWDDRKKREERDLPRRLKVILKRLTREVQGVDYVYQTLLDSDDMYYSKAVEEIQKQKPGYKKAFGYKNGYVMKYETGELAHWNPKTNPPFYTIIFPVETFLDAESHIGYTGAYKSHENVAETMSFRYLPGRKYIVGIHGNNVRTFWNHRFRGEIIK